MDRELHNAVGRNIALTGLGAEAVIRLVHDDPQTAARLLQELGSTMRATMADLRHVVGALWDIEELAPRHASDLESIIRRFDGTDLAVAMDGPANLEALPAPIRDMVAAEIAEGLTEVVRHARAHHAVVLLQKSDNALLVNIADDGCGPPANDNVGFGLLGLR